MDIFSTQSEAILSAVQAQRSGMLSDDARSICRLHDGRFVAVCRFCEPCGAKVVATVAKCRVYQDGI